MAVIPFPLLLLFNRHCPFLPKQICYNLSHILSPNITTSPQAGTTSWLSLLLTWAGMNVQDMGPEEIHAAAKEIFPSLGPKEAAAEMNFPAFTFTAVRHPFTR